MDFEQWFRERTRGFEVFLIRAVLLFLVLLLAAQLVQTIPGVRNFISLVDRREGRPYVPPATETAAPAPVSGEEHYLVLKIDSGQVDTLVEVLVNGRSVTDFSREKTVTVFVREGDVVDIDGDLPAREVEVVVSAVSGGVIRPESGRRIVFNGIMETVGQVVATEP